MHAHVRLVPLACAGVAGLVLLAACGKSQPYGSAAPSASATSAAATPTTPASSPAAPATTLKVAQTTLGAVVTGPDGRTLYRYDEDTAKPSASHCTGACASTWLPLTGDARKVSAPGIAASLIASITRADGTTQLTLAGWPLYYFARDTKPGDTNGDGVGSVWHAIGPNGRNAASGGGDGGYGYGGG